ncbi:MAG: anti-sigma factor antagonist [Candidatus Omnitrophota bacterium]|jgi:anti-anti-sigma factor|nr:MAG: anti-sigma factor antagonist [Candidatus Omnitrophota bacterium]
MIPLQRDDHGEVTILRIKGELDFENTVWLRGELHDLLKHNRVRVLLDMADVDIISSYTVGVFVAFARDLRDHGGDLKFLNLQKRVKQTFEATRIDHILQVFDAEADALKSY